MFDSEKLHSAEVNGVYVKIGKLDPKHHEDPIVVELFRDEGNWCPEWYVWTKSQGWSSKPSQVGCPFEERELPRDFHEARLTLLWLKKYQNMLPLQEFLEQTNG